MVYLWPLLKVKVKGHAHFEWEYLINGDRWGKNYYCRQTYDIKSCLDFQFAYLRLISTHSKGSHQGHTDFDCEYFVNNLL